jgi:hypothetical protein
LIQIRDLFSLKDYFGIPLDKGSTSSYSYEPPFRTVMEAGVTREAGVTLEVLQANASRRATHGVGEQPDPTTDTAAGRGDDVFSLSFSLPVGSASSERMGASAGGSLGPGAAGAAGVAGAAGAAGVPRSARADDGGDEETSTWQRLATELTLGVAAEWPQLPTFRRRWRAVTFPALMPMYAALRLTIPLVDPGTYNQQAR